MMKKTGRCRRRLRLFWRRNYALLILLPLLALLLFYAEKVEPHCWRLQRYEVDSDCWPQELDGMKIAFLSDFHFDANVTAMLPELFAAVSKETPDLVLLGGDFFTRGIVLPESMKILQQELSLLHPRFGIYAVTGNHESPETEAATLFQPLADRGVRWLMDESVHLGPETGGFTLIGLAYKERLPGEAGRIVAALATAGKPAILLAHNPDRFAEQRFPVLLMLSGHTHGGQIRLPGTGSLIHPVRYPKEYDYGKVTEEGRTLITTGGLGMSRIRLRFNVPPEAVIVTLRSVPRLAGSEVR